MVKFVPQNKLFLSIALCLIIVLSVVKFVPWTKITAASNTQVNFRDVVSVVTRELGIRSRHQELQKNFTQWRNVFFQGQRRALSLKLAGMVERWADETQLTVESTRLLLDLPDESGLPRVGIELNGRSGFSQIMRFIRKVENEEYFIQPIQLRLEQSGDKNNQRYHIRIVAPYIPNNGGAAK
jgi:hypothetical protein